MPLSRVLIPFCVETRVSVKKEPSGAVEAVEPVVGATIVAKHRITSGTGSLYTTETSSTPAASPVTDENGNIPYWIEEGPWNITVSGGTPTLAPVTYAFDALSARGITAYAAESITAPSLAANAVTLAKMAANSVGTTALVDGSVTPAKVKYWPSEGTLAAIPGPGNKGRLYRVAGDATALNNGVVWWDNGSAWVALEEAVKVPATPVSRTLGKSEEIHPTRPSIVTVNMRLFSGGVGEGPAFWEGALSRNGTNLYPLGGYAAEKSTVSSSYTFGLPAAGKFTVSLTRLVGGPGATLGLVSDHVLL